MHFFTTNRRVFTRIGMRGVKCGKMIYKSLKIFL